MRYLYILLLGVLLVGCKETDSSSLTAKELMQIKTEIISRGSKSSYARLDNYYKNTSNYFEILPYSLMMINKYNDKYSYIRILEVMIKMNNNSKYELSNIKSLSKGDQYFITYYLLKGAGQEDPESIKILTELNRQG